MSDLWTREEWKDMIDQLGDQVDKEYEQAKDAYNEWKEAINHSVDVMSGDYTFEEAAEAFADELSAEMKFDKESKEFDNICNDWNNNMTEYLQSECDDDSDAGEDGETGSEM